MHFNTAATTTTNTGTPADESEDSSYTTTADVALAQKGARSTTSATVGVKYYRPTPQPSSGPLSESLGAKSLANSTCNLDMLVSSELAVVAAVDPDRQLTVRQQPLFQSTEPPTSTPTGAGVNMEVDASGTHSPTMSRLPMKCSC